MALAALINIITHFMAQKSSGMGGVALAGITAAAIAGGYFFYGKDGAKHRKVLKSWTMKAKAEIMEKLEKAKELSEDSYHQAIDMIADKYAKNKSMDSAEIAAFAANLKKHWKDIKREIMPKSPAKKSAKKSSKKK